MGVRVGTRVGPFWISVGVGGLILVLCCLGSLPFGLASAAADSIQSGTFDWTVPILFACSVLFIAAFTGFAFWFNSPRQVQRRQQRRQNH